MNKIILITGATSGFGKACAEIFGTDGWRLIICGRRENRLLEISRNFPEGQVHCLPLDVRDRRQVNDMLSGLPPEFRDIDVLCNNAGLALGLKPAQEADLDDWEQMIDTNIKGLCYVTRTVLPGMVNRNRGHIINIGSVAGTWPYPGGNAYGATKAFVKQFSNNLQADLLGTRVRVTNIEPGLAETEFSIVRFHGDKARADDVYRGTEPLTGKDIAEIVYWVTSVPAHVNINAVEVMPVCQSWSPFAIHRTTNAGCR
ncbi:MAG TPA: SDR family oxidoreductase [Desulfobacteraceae bacterium]|nr:SDR family oxidoreductase [Desulfobacteraceae bacterium]